MSEPKTTAEGAGAATRGRTLRWAAAAWPRLRRPVIALAGVAAVLASTSAVWGINLYLSIEGGRPRSVDIPELVQESDFADRPRNVLLLGSDTRAGLTPEEQAAFGSPQTVGGERSDTIILLHIDPRRERAVVVHFPRDLRVEIPDHGTDKINAAYEYGGPRLVVRTVRQYTGLPIHNYMEIDLAGFQELVDTLGGVRLCVDRPLHDELAGLDIDRSGCHTLDGAEALAFVRARNIEGDTIPDFSRIARQQQFIRAMLNRLLSVRNLLDDEVIQEAAAKVTTDTELSTADLLLLGSTLRQLAQEDPSGSRSLDFRVVPGTAQTIDGVSYVIADQEAEELFERLAEGRPLGNLGLSLALTLPSPAVIEVEVLASGLTEEAEEAEAYLRRAGFIVLGTRPAPTGLEASEILYRPGTGPKSQVVAGFFPGLPRREVSASILGDAEVALVVGDDFTTAVQE
jgi:LCP family protein required for cell wall assembly